MWRQDPSYVAGRYLVGVWGWAQGAAGHDGSEWAVEARAVGAYTRQLFGTM